MQNAARLIFTVLGDAVAENHGADFVKSLVPALCARTRRCLECLATSEGHLDILKSSFFLTWKRHSQAQDCSRTSSKESTQEKIDSTCCRL